MTTVLAAPAEGAWSRITLWRQCVDLLAQYDDGSDNPDLDRIVRTLEGLGGDVDTTQKLASVVELGGRLRSPRLVRVLSRDQGPVLVAVMNRARLSDAQWPAIIAEAGPLARSVLRRRPDLGINARHALAAFGSTDLALLDFSVAQAAEALSPVEGAPSPEEEQESQIRRIVDRIERFTSERHARAEPLAPWADHGPATPDAVERFAFATDAAGMIVEAGGVARSLLVGLAVGTAGADRSVGPDGQILGAFRRRAAFRDGRLTIGEGLLAGCWLVNGEPRFDRRTGRFTGYRASARRASAQEQAPRGRTEDPGIATLVEATSDATSLRQLIHELRTPLTGVMGFAELIESALLGPVADSYRGMAGEIVADVRSLVDILDDLDQANRSDGRRPAGTGDARDMATLIGDVVHRFATDETGAPRIHFSSDADVPPLDVAAPVAERIVMHLVRALVACAGGEVLAARSFAGQGGQAMLVIDRPHAIASLSEAELFDPGMDHAANDPDAPILGIGFALRLVRKLAVANQGALTVDAAHFTLALPGVAQAASIGQS